MAVSKSPAGGARTLAAAKRTAGSEQSTVRVAKKSRSQASFTFAEQARSYDVSSTVTMESDQDRVGFYREALKKVARNKTVLDIGTGDHGILARLALEIKQKVERFQASQRRASKHDANTSSVNGRRKSKQEEDSKKKTGSDLDSLVLMREILDKKHVLK